MGDIEELDYATMLDKIVPMTDLAYIVIPNLWGNIGIIKTMKHFSRFADGSKMALSVLLGKALRYEQGDEDESNFMKAMQTTQD